MDKEFSLENLKEFVEDVLANKLNPFLKSEVSALRVSTMPLDPKRLFIRRLVLGCARGARRS